MEQTDKIAGHASDTKRRSTDLALAVIQGRAMISQAHEQLAVDLAPMLGAAAVDALKLGGYPRPDDAGYAALSMMVRVMLLAAILEGYDRERIAALAPHFGAVAVVNVFGTRVGAN